MVEIDVANQKRRGNRDNCNARRDAQTGENHRTGLEREVKQKLINCRQLHRENFDVHTVGTRFTLQLVFVSGDLIETFYCYLISGNPIESPNESQNRNYARRECFRILYGLCLLAELVLVLNFAGFEQFVKRERAGEKVDVQSCV